MGGTGQLQVIFDRVLQVIEAGEPGVNVTSGEVERVVVIPKSRRKIVVIVVVGVKL